HALPIFNFALPEDEYTSRDWLGSRTGEDIIVCPARNRFTLPGSVPVVRVSFLLINSSASAVEYIQRAIGILFNSIDDPQIIGCVSVGRERNGRANVDKGSIDGDGYFCFG